MIRRLEKDGGTFRMHPAERGAGASSSRLTAVSDDWLAGKASRRRRDSRWDSSTPSICRASRRLLSNAAGGSWRSPTCGWMPTAAAVARSRCAIHRDAPRDVMEALLRPRDAVGQASEGYRWFALGMAPLSGFRNLAGGARSGAGSARFLYQHGEALYSFQGLRAYKQKFNPDWRTALPGAPGRHELAAHPRRRVGARSPAAIVTSSAK